MVLAAAVTPPWMSETEDLSWLNLDKTQKGAQAGVREEEATLDLGITMTLTLIL